MPNIQVDGEAAPEDEQVKSVGDENRPIVRWMSQKNLWMKKPLSTSLSVFL